MKIRLFYHSLVSDWNHGNAHFLRGVVSELIRQGHDVLVYEPEDSWSRENLIHFHGEEPLREFAAAFPGLQSQFYNPGNFNLASAVQGADLVLAHEWNDPQLIAELGKIRSRQSFTLLFHDTHHRLVTQPEAMRAFDLQFYDGVLAYGDVLRNLYLESGLARRAWTWHEAADATRFRPQPRTPRTADLVWVGNWGDDERTAELEEFLIAPVQRLGLTATVYGVRYPEDALASLRRAGITYGGWLPNFRVPEVFARHRVTVHVPRRPYVEALPGIPTIRPFEALSCGIPLVSALWQDVEGLFTPGLDYLCAATGEEMEAQLARVLGDPELQSCLAAHGRSTILKRHTCAHRAAELLEIHGELTGGTRTARPSLRRAPASPSPTAAAGTASVFPRP